MKYFNSKSGFTLIEVILAITILSTLTLLSTQALSRALKAKNKIQAEVDDVSSLRDTMRMIRSDLNLAYHHRDFEKEIFDLVVGPQSKYAPPASPGTMQQYTPKPNLQLPPRENKRIDPTTDFIGAEDKMDFVTMNSGRTTANQLQADFIEVGYSLKDCRNLSDNSKSSKCLFRRTQGVLDEKPDEGGTEVVLLENVSEFKLRYIGEGKQDWVSTWRTDQGGDGATKGKYPEVVEVSLGIKHTVDKKEKSYSMQFVIPIHFPNNPQKGNSPDPLGNVNQGIPPAPGGGTR